MYYVYELIDPRSGEPFYIGKGCGRRIYDHENEARRVVSSAKCDKIREIFSLGLEIIKRKVKSFDDESEAYSFEAEHIARVGRVNLTNIMPGGGSPRAIGQNEVDYDCIDSCSKLIKVMARMGVSMFDQVCADLIFSVVERRGIEWVNNISVKHSVSIEVR